MPAADGPVYYQNRDAILTSDNRVPMLNAMKRSDIPVEMLRSTKDYILKSGTRLIDISAVVLSAPFIEKWGDREIVSRLVSWPHRLSCF